VYVFITVFITTPIILMLQFKNLEMIHKLFIISSFFLVIILAMFDHIVR